MAADRIVPWNNLPTELLESIANHLKTKIEISRFRSICKSWRSSIPPFVHHKLQPHFPIRIFMMPNPGPSRNFNAFILTITETVVYNLVHAPTSNSDSSASTSRSKGWIVKLRDGGSDDKTCMLHPLSSSRMKRLPKSVFPKMLNLLHFRVFELAKIYSSMNESSETRIAISFSPNRPATMMVCLGKLYRAYLGDGMQNGTMVNDRTAKFFTDVIYYDQKFYAVCHNSTTVVVDYSLKMELIASPISPDHGSGVRSVQNLMESRGEILLVERYPSRMKQRRLNPVSFKVYKLNAVERKWVEMESLDGRILCVGNNYCFSVDADDFPACQKNCIYFSDPWFIRCYGNYSLGKKFKIGMFNLEDGSMILLLTYPQLGPCLLAKGRSKIETFRLFAMCW